MLVFEDLHWTDPTSLEVIDHLMACTDRAPVALLALFRPQRQEPSWRFHETAERDCVDRYTTIALEPLDEDSSRSLVANLLQIEDLPESVRGLILTKAEGNPFYVEEVIRSLLDAQLVVWEDGHWRATREIDSIAVPDTLAGVINARLDRLEPQPRRVAQTASVIGREFDFDTLADVHETIQQLDGSLAELQRRELVREKSPLPERVYIYKHALTQETVYATLLMSTRRTLHRRVAECLVQMEPDRVGEIARHFMEAREQEQALPYLIEAGDRAAKAYSSEEAIRFYTQSLEILETVEDAQLGRRAYEGLGGALTFARDVPGAVANYHAMFHAGEQHGDLPMKVSALNKLGFVTALMQGQFPEAEGHLAQAERLANECEDLSGLAELHMTYCYLRVPIGEFDDAMGHLSESARIGSELELEEPRLFGLTHTANTLAYMTRFEESRQTGLEALQLAEELGNRRWKAELLALPSALYHLRNGDLDAAGRSAEEGMSLATQIGSAEVEGYGAFMLGQLSWLKGDYERAVALQKQAAQAGRDSGMTYIEVAALCSLGTAYQDISQELMDSTRECHDKALALMETPLGAVLGASCRAELGFSVLAVGDVDGASELFQKGFDVPSGMKYLARPMLLTGSAFVALAKGDPDEAQRLLTEAREFVYEREMKHFYPLVAFGEAQERGARGDAEGALQCLARGEEAALEMEMRPMVWQARAGAAGILASLGRADDAQAKRRGARDMIDEIARLFEDENLRRLYLESATAKLG